MNKKMVKGLVMIIAVCMLVAGCGGINTQETGETHVSFEAEETLSDETSAEADAALDAEISIDVTQLKPEGGAPDLAELQKVNPEAYAWIEIVGTNMSYPLLQSASDEYFYLSHNIYGEEDDDGCIYTEYYNDTDFGDKNTVIYGRNTSEMFGRLHQYQDRDFFDNHREIRIYQGDSCLTYQIFAAYTYDDRHLIATYDFSDETVYGRYLEDVFAIRAMDAYIDDSVEVTVQDRIITLSTGVTGEDEKRYLVQAVLVDEE